MGDAVIATFVPVGIAHVRYYHRYFNRYFPEDHRRIWPYLKRMWRVRYVSLLKPVDDPRIEVLRRQLLLAYGAAFALVVIPIVLARVPLTR